MFLKGASRLAFAQSARVSSPLGAAGTPRGAGSVAGFAVLVAVVAGLVAYPALRSTAPARHGTLTAGSGAARSRTASAGVRARAVRAYGRLPLRFEPNLGQTDRRVRFLSRGPGYTLFLTGQEAVISLVRTHEAAPAVGSPVGAPSAQPQTTSAVVRMGLVGASPTPRLSSAGRLPGVSNYLKGRDPSRWHTGVPGYAQVRYAGVYPGIDLVYLGRQGHLEYDFSLAPHADPGRIALSFTGPRRLWLDRAGDLVLWTRAGIMREPHPVLYQQVDGVRRTVTGRYVLAGRQVRFQVGRYDHSRQLVIDPALVYSTYLGGQTGGTFGTDIVAADSSGAAYVAGTTNETDFPTTTGAFRTAKAGAANPGSEDVFITKLSPTGALVYSTYLGGSTSDSAAGIAVDSSGRAYVTGETGSSDFPVTAGAFASTLSAVGSSAFLTVLKTDGSGLDYSTYLGASTGYSSAGGVAVDSSGRAYLTGGTSATDFPTKAPAPATPYQTTSGGNGDAFVAEIDPALSGASSLIYSTFLGGTGADGGSAIALDVGGNAYVGGYTASTDFPTKNGFQSTTGGSYDGFVAELDPTGSALKYSTYLGGSSNDSLRGIALDATNRVYVTGETTSTDFPTVNAFHPAPPVDNNRDAFVTKIDPAATGASSLVYSSYLGGPGESSGHAIAVTPSGTAYVVGEADIYRNDTAPPGSFPTVDPVAPFATGGDAFVSAVKPDGSGLSFSSYLGGGGEDLATGVALDPSGNVYLAGGTSSTDMPTLNAFQSQNPGLGRTDREQSFVAKLAPVAAAAPLVTGLSHRSGPAYTPVVIAGHGFSGASAVSFGSVAAASFTVDSDGQITALAPSGVTGAVPVTVTTGQGISPPNPIATFTYATGTWDLTGSLRVPPLNDEVGVVLSDGRVLVAGGDDANQNALAKAELYDPSSGRWTTTESMGTARGQFTATLLSDGRVLVAGGYDVNFSALASAELYDPASGTWTATGSLAVARQGQTATLLSNGKVLVAGGLDSSFSPTSSAELYDPAAGTWSPAGTMAQARSDHRATLLANGKVLVVGGYDARERPIASAELYDPASNSWSTTGPMSTGRADPTATRLPDGRVLIAGGSSGPAGSEAVNSADIYDPTSGMFSFAAAMTDPRAQAAAAVLPDGRVLVTGGFEDNSEHNTAELYDPATGQWSSAGFMNRYRATWGIYQLGGLFALALPNGKVLVGGGDGQSTDPTTELYNPAAPAAPSSGSGSGSGAGTGSGSASGSGAGTGTGGAGTNSTRPVVTHYGLTNNPFVVAAGGTPLFGSAALVRRHKHGTTFTYTLSEAATVRIAISQRLPGRRRARSCAAPSRKLRHAKRCVRILPKGTLTRTSHQGANKIAFSGRLRATALKPGRYQATLIATDAAKHGSKKQTLYFRIVKR